MACVSSPPRQGFPTAKAEGDRAGQGELGLRGSSVLGCVPSLPWDAFALPWVCFWSAAPDL